MASSSDILQKDNQLEQEFHISRYIIFYKLGLGIIEVILGVGIWIWGRSILRVYEEFRREQLLEDPHYLLGLIFERVMPFITEHLGFLIFFLLLIGISKVVGAIGLLKRKHWGLDILVVVTICLLPFELFDIATRFSISKFGYFLINLLIALYLVNFRPIEYFKKFNQRYIHLKIR